MLIAGRSIASLLFNKVTLAIAAFALVAWGLYLGVTELRDAGVAEGQAVERAEGLAQSVRAHKATIEAWEARYTEIAAQRATDDAKLAERIEELRAAQAELARRQEDFNNAIDNLEGMDGTCARRPVPDVVDSLLGSPRPADPASGAAGDR